MLWRDFTFLKEQSKYVRILRKVMVTEKDNISTSGDVAQWTSHPPLRQSTRVRIPPGFNAFRKDTAMLLCAIALMCIACQ
jgi:hypothetical protein